MKHADSKVVLASASQWRAAMLENAGVSVAIDPAHIDEDEIKISFAAENMPPEAAAEALAELKAMRVSPRHPDALVIGADQMLECGGKWFDKPADMDAARAQLKSLRGKPHYLMSCAVIVKDGQRLWHHIDKARLDMRDFSDAFLDAYMARCGSEICQTVGGYRLEAEGAQLFSRIRGDYFTILGLPLLPVLDYLRTHGLLLK